MGLFGRNGSGKSTLLKMMYGTLRASSIEMSFEGDVISPQQVIPKKLIGYVPQHPFLPPGLKIRNIIPIYFSGQESQDRVFYDTTIAEFTHQKVGDLSHGQRKYFEVVLTANMDHPFLFLDEPFSMLEPLQIEQLKIKLKEASLNKGIIITDHYYRDVLDCTNKNVVLHEGYTHKISSESDLKQFEYLSKKQ